MAGLAKASGIDPNSVTWVNIDANSKLERAQGQDGRDATTSFFNLHHVFARELGADMGSWRGRTPAQSLRNSIIANGAWLKTNKDTADKFSQDHAEGFCRVHQDSRPCVKALVEANGALLYDNELTNWHLVTILMSARPRATSRSVGTTMPAWRPTTSWSMNISRWKSRTTSRRPTPTSSSTRPSRAADQSAKLY